MDEKHLCNGYSADQIADLRAFFGHRMEVPRQATLRSLGFNLSRFGHAHEYCGSRQRSSAIQPHASRKLLIATILIAATATVVQAAAPDVKYLYPAGSACGTTVEVSPGGNAGDWPPQVWVNRPDVTVVPAAEKGKLSVTVSPDAVPGVRWIRVYNAQGAAAPLPFVVGTLPEVNEQEPNDIATKPQALANSACVVNGRLEKRGDVDTFAVSLRKGQTLVAAVTANETLGSPMDAVLEIVSARGSVLAENDDERGLDPLLPFTAPADGLYLVRLFAFPSTADASISFAGGENFVYRLTVTTGTFLEASLPLVVSQPGPTEVELFGWNLPDADRRRTLEAPNIELFSPEWVNSLSLPLVAHRSVVEKEPNDVAAPQALELPAVVSGRIGEPRDRDAFRVHLTKGQWDFSIESRSLGYPLDAVLELFEAGGKSLARADDSGNKRDAELKFTAPADGDYTLVVSDLYEHGGARYFYRLSIAPPEADFAVSIPQHAYTASVGKPLEIPLTIDRRSGFEGEIDIRVEALPEGITASPAKSAAKGETAKSVKLTITGTLPFAGPIRIIGTSAEPVSRTNLAEFPAAAGARLSDLWLTVVP